MVDLAIYMRPSVIILENVRGFHDTRHADYLVVLAKLHSNGYSVNAYRINSGVWDGASRDRVYIVAQLFGCDILGSLVDRCARMPLKPLGAVVPAIRALWHAVRPRGYGPGGDSCVIPASRVYPAIDTKCLRPPPARYAPHPSDHPGGLSQCHVPDAHTIMIFLGLPYD